MRKSRRQPLAELEREALARAVESAGDRSIAESRGVSRLAIARAIAGRPLNQSTLRLLGASNA